MSDLCTEVTDEQIAFEKAARKGNKRENRF